MNLTVGKRIVLGFSVVLVFLVAVGALSYFGVGGIVHNATEVIVGNKLDGEMAQKEVDHLNWANDVSALLTDDSVTDLNVQLDPTQCAFGKWLYSEARREAEARIPSIAPLLREIETYHNNLHASAAEIGEKFRQPHPGLALTLSDRWADHVGWVSTCGTSLAAEGGGMARYQMLVKNAVDQAFSIVESCAEDSSLGDQAARQTQVKKLVAALRYGPEHKDYFWINDTAPTMIMHPFKPEMNGQDLSRQADPKGNRMFVNMAQVAQAQGAGFVMYYWPMPGHPQPVPKISYVRYYEPWDWVIGTGVFLDANNEALLARAEKYATGQSFSLGVQTDPTQCAFGKFLASPETRELCDEFPEFKAAIDRCRPPHDRLHASATKIEELVSADQFTQAMVVFKNETQVALEEMRGHFQAAIQAETTLADAAAAANTIFARKTKANLEQVQGLLNQIRDEIKGNIMTDEAMLAAARNTRWQVMVVGAIALVLGIVLAIMIARGLVRVLQRLIVQLNDGADQVADASNQVASSSQQLAEGASEQASSLEETSSALEQLAAMTQRNADSAITANDEARKASAAAQEGDQTTGQLNGAMSAINESAEKISKIIKVIEEIAFQTNLLALNAAVEAARAGEHGKGFAVVADEVRNLAQRCAEAARETTVLIEDSVNRAREGGQVGGRVAEVLNSITKSASKVNELIDSIAQASAEQSTGINQVNDAVAQMDKVTQSNAAGAEEAASASEELSAQAQTVKQIVEELVRLAGGTGTATAGRHAASATRKEPAPAPQTVLMGANNDLADSDW